MPLTHRHLEAVLTATGLTYGSFLAGNLVTLLAVVLVTSVGVQLAQHPGIRLLLSTLLLQGVTFGSISLAYLKARDLSTDYVPVTVPSRRGIVVTAGGILTLFGLLFGASYLLATLGIESAESQIIETGREAPWVLLALVPLSYVVVAPAEEYLYRGLVQGRLRETTSAIVAVIIASLLFASIHLPSLSRTAAEQAVSLGLTFSLALALGGIYEYTGNLSVPVIAHGTFNAAQFASTYLNVTGGL